jgi:hypothetical protein
MLVINSQMTQYSWVKVLELLISSVGYTFNVEMTMKHLE